MAGIVASTLRRRTFRHKSSIDSRFQQQQQPQQPGCDPGCVNAIGASTLSPHSGADCSTGQTGGAQHGLARSPSRSSSVRRKSFSSGRSPGAGNRRVYAPKGAKLFHEDFWPMCANEAEQNLRAVKFDSFDTLIPKANSWLRDNLDVILIKCETLEKKISTIEQVHADCIVFVPKGNFALHIKGLRLWYVYNNELTKIALQNTSQTEIGYMNVIPKCIDSLAKYPVYENLPDTYAAINAYLAESPLEGKILTIETLPLKLARKMWPGPEHINPDQTYFCDEYLHHVLYITRIYFVYGSVERELIGAQDFLPDFERSASCLAFTGLFPKYQPTASTMQKAKVWIDSARNIRVTNIQTLQAVYRCQPENVDTGLNFVEKAESSPLIRFARVTYVRPASAVNDPDSSSKATAGTSKVPSAAAETTAELASKTLALTAVDVTDESSSKNVATTSGVVYAPPSGLAYRTFIPAAVKVGMCSGAPEYESFTATWERSKAWLKCIERRVISAESFYHPLRLVWHGQDGVETTVMHGEWTTSHRGEWRYQQRRELVQIVRVYLDGDYQEPDALMLPPSPMVEEINDCRCIVM